MPAGNKALALSLFPRTNGQGRNGQFVAAAQTSASSKNLQKKRDQNDLLTSNRDLSRTVLQQPCQEGCEVDGGSSVANVHHSDAANAEDFVSDHEPGLPSIRGESSTRCRHSGMPVYDIDAASLRSADRHNEQLQAADLHGDTQCLTRAVSAQTGNSRYFSAASIGLGTQALSQTQSQERDQERRAVANGALRFSGRNAIPSDATPQRPTPSNENAFPMIPVTVTRASRTYCPHRLAKLHREQARRHTDFNLDGTSPPPITSQDPPPTSGELPLPTRPTLQTMLPQPSVESFGHRHHISRRINHGTWRTRMKRTKCWRCELESRRTASSEALYRRMSGLFTGWGPRMERLKEKLRWTCFCRYRAYEDDSEDPEEAEERARLGRMGGNLT